MGRIDLGDDDSQDELADALKQLEEQSRQEQSGSEPVREAGETREEFEERRREEHRRTREGLEEAVEEIRELREVAERRPRPGEGAGAAVRWVVIVALAAAVIVAGVLKLRPTPLPPAADTAQEAVGGFWSALIAGSYEGATVYYPALVDRYDSRKQAAMRLEEYFGDNPPVNIKSIGEPEQLPDSTDLRVSYEVVLRSGRPRTGEFIVAHSGQRETGYVIITGP
jgi:hypothetical protein